jgi:hypothetical protein
VLKKLIAPLVIGGALLGGVASAGSAYAGTPTPAATAAPSTHTGRQQLRAWLRAHRRQIRRDAVTISAKAIGVTSTQLVTELRSGTSIAAVAGQHNVSAQSVINALVSAADAKVNRALTDHKLTSAAAAAIEAALPTYVTKAVSHTF